MSSPSSKEIRKAKTKAIVNSIELGVSFSVKTCRDYNIDWYECLKSLLELGVRRFRIMSYWDLHEPEDGHLDCSLLDAQLNLIEQSGAKATLCIGMRQPRWPETHVPSWSLSLSVDERTKKYMLYHAAVIERYKGRICIESWQLENEFWNKSFGLNNTFSRKRLKKEFEILRKNDPERPVIMTLGNTVGLPIFSPKPDLFGTTMYLVQYEKGRYSLSKYTPLYFKIRSWLVKIIGMRNLIIHELQAEPWGPKANWEMSDEEQSISMNSEQIKKCIAFAKKSGMTYIDLWGGEWWYWRKTAHKDIELWSTISSELNNSKHVS